jgi:hypothetical protein
MFIRNIGQGSFYSNLLTSVNKQNRLKIAITCLACTVLLAGMIYICRNFWINRKIKNLPNPNPPLEPIPNQAPGPNQVLPLSPPHSPKEKEVTCTCQITVKKELPEFSTMGAFLANPQNHVNHTIRIYTKKLFCDAKFINLKHEDENLSNFNTKFTLIVFSHLKHIDSVNELGKKTLWGMKNEDVLQNDRYCPTGAITDPELFAMMNSAVLKKLNYNDLAKGSPENAKFKWDVVIQE